MELEVSFREDLDVGRDAGRVVCLSRRKILEKLTSLCPFSRLYVVSWEEADETASSTRDQGRALSTESGTGGPGNLRRHLARRFRGSGAVLAGTKADMIAWPRPSDDKNAPRRR